jgi:cytochrome c-type biogenesis protein CcmH/NrfG
MKPRIQCSNCDSELRLGDERCRKCGQPVEWPEARHDKRSGRSGGKGDRGIAEQRPRGTGTGLSSTGKLVTGLAVVIVVGAVGYELIFGTRSQTQGSPTQAIPPGDAPAMGQVGPNAQAAAQLADMESAALKNPQNHELVLQAANFAHDNGYFEKAVTYYDRYLGSHPDNVNAMVDKGTCLHELKRSEEAITVVKQALKIEPNHLQANYNLGVINLQLGNVQEANKYFSKVVSIAPTSEMGMRAQQLLAPHANLPPK